MKIFYLSRLVLLFLINYFVKLPAQSYNVKFEHLTSDNGLSENVVDAVFQDKCGFLWIGTDEGLDRFDGYNFIIYRNDPLDTNSLSGNMIHYIYQDKSGMMWISTSKGGLDSFNPRTNKFTRYMHNDYISGSISSNNINEVCEDDFNNFWVCTDKGLDKMDRSKGRFWKYRGNNNSLYDILGESYVTTLLAEKEILWVGTKTGFYKVNINTGKLKIYKHNPKDQYSISSNFVTSLCRDKNGLLWIGTFGGGLCQFDTQSGKFISFRHNKRNSHSLSSDFVQSIVIDQNNLLWIGTSNDGGLNILDMDRKIFYVYKNHPDNQESLSQNEVQCVYQDRAGTIWIGTFGGLNKYDTIRKKFRTLDVEKEERISLSEKEVHAVFEDADGILWVGTWGGGLDKINRRESLVKVFKNNPADRTSISSNDITCILQDKNKKIWIGTANGMNEFDEKRNCFKIFKYKPTSDSFYDNAILTLFQDKEGTLWAGTWMQGLLKFDKKSGNFYSYRNDPKKKGTISSNMITSIYEDKEGNFWIGTWKGLNKFDRGKNTFSTFLNDPQSRNTISNNSIICLLEDPLEKDRILWLGTWAGLDKFDLYTHKSVNFRSSAMTFPSDEISGILSDNSNKLWIASNKGLTSFNISDSVFRTYNKSDGLQGNEFEGRACFKSEKGELFFGGENGLSSFFPDSLTDNSYKPPVVITSFKKFNKEAVLDTNISYVHRLELSYKDYVFSFEFSALNFIHSEKNKYRYKLTGFDKDWVEAGNRRSATYTNLDPGEYTFKVKAANNDGVWNPLPASVSIIISPPFWETWWFESSGFIGFVAFILFVFNKRTAKMKSEKHSQEEFSRKLIESQEGERKRIAGELHDSLAQNLLIIKNKALYSLKNLKDTKVLSEQLDSISELTSSTLAGVREISYNLHPYQLDRLGLTKAIQSIFDRISGTPQISFEVNMDLIDEIFNPKVEINIFRITQECINNIIKHSEATKVKFEIRVKDEQVIISIIDNGKGFNASNSSPISKKQGLGLKNISERVKLIRGKIEIKTQPGRGTRIFIFIPIIVN